MATLVLVIGVAAPVSKITCQWIVRAGYEWFSKHIQSILIHCQLSIRSMFVKHLGGDRTAEGIFRLVF